MIIYDDKSEYVNDKQLRIRVRVAASSLSPASQQSIVENQVDDFYEGENTAANQQSKVSAYIAYKYEPVRYCLL